LVLAPGFRPNSVVISEVVFSANRKVIAAATTKKNTPIPTLRLSLMAIALVDSAAVLNGNLLNSF
jgi:hypothetical protein